MRNNALAFGIAFIFALASGCGSGGDTGSSSSASGGSGPGSSADSSSGTLSGSSSGNGGASASSSGAGGASTSSGSTSSGMSSSSGGPKPCVNDADCDDMFYCTGVEVCTAGFCVAGVPPMCNDGIACTDDFCGEMQKACQHVVNDNNCSDGLFCNGAEKCDPPNGNPMTGCKPSVGPPNCNDAVPCTVDSCSEAQKACVHAPDNLACTNGIFCDGAEVCDPVMGCIPGAPQTCDDGLACTADSCSEAQKQCLHVVNNAFCDNGLFCDGLESCSVAGAPPSGCIKGPAVPCPSDGIPCTDDVCNEPTKTCVHIANNNNCPMGQFCAQNGCASGMPCMNSAQCQDNNLCNGVEACVGGACQPGLQVNCDDGKLCTIDTCVPATGMCNHVPDNGLCDNGLACDGIETCNVQLGCVSTPPIDCNDGFSCTLDGCNEPNGTCVHVPNNAACTDGQLCNGLEVCDPPNGNPLTGCKPGAPFVCPSDGVACTADTCNPMTNQCVYTPDDSLCPCTQTCSIQQGGCGNFCNVGTCQGKVYQCGDCLDNDGDCRIDSGDNQCLGPCDNTEDTFYGGIPGQNNSPCKSDCYFDADTGSGNDDCYWSHKCDPFEVPPNYPPEGNQCTYNMNANIPGTNQSCSQLYLMQSMACLNYCGPLTPNGCDCFGCCVIPGAPTTVWLGSENPPGTGSCNINTVNDPSKCKPCTQVQACLNPCGMCEICVGQPLPPGCGQQSCDNGAQPCGLPGQAPCPLGYSCITGCCQQNPG